MILKKLADLWQPCEADTKNGICIPATTEAHIKFYAHGQVTAVSVIDCATGVSTAMNLADWDYVIATDPNGDAYSYFTTPTLPGGLGTCFYFEVTFGGEQYYTPCYQDITGLGCIRDTTWIESSFAGFDCLGRWYGAPTPQSLIAGNNELAFNNGMLIWGTLAVLPTEFEFTNFDDCITTKTKAVKGYELEALSIAPYFVEMVEAIIGRGVIWLDDTHTTQYAVKPGTHFEKIRAFCRSQYDMRLNLTDCGCEIHHECDLGYDYVPVLDCESALNYHCETAEVECMNMYPCTAVVTRNPGSMEFVFTDPTLGGNDVVRANELSLLLTNCVLNNYALQILTNINLYYFYAPYISNILQVGNTVTFDYSDFFTPPVTFDCELNFINDDNWAVFEAQNIGATNDICCYSASIEFELTVSGSPILNTIWSANVPFTQIDLTHISVALPQGGDITVTVDVFPELCGDVTITATINDTPTYEGRFLAADATIVWDSMARFIRFTEASYYLNTSLSSLQWNVFNVGNGYSGGSATTSNTSPFTLTGVGIADDFVVELIVTDIHGNISKNYFLFGQNRNVPDEDFLMWARATAAAFTGTSVDITTTYALPVNTYALPITADEVGLDADMDATYEQTAAAAGVPVVFTHDYLTTGVFNGRVGVSVLESVPPPPAAGSYAAIPFGLIRCEYAAQIV